MRQFESTLQAVSKNFKDPSVLGVFVNNHDNARFLNNNYNIPKFRNAIAFSLMTGKESNICLIFLINLYRKKHFKN